jgi:hypothetical protein
MYADDGVLCAFFDGFNIGVTSKLQGSSVSLFD